MWKQALAVLILLIAGYGLGRYTAPSKVVEKEVVKYQDRVVEKKVFVKDTIKKDNKITIRLKTIKPDGTITIETKILDKDELIIVQNDKDIIDSNKTVDKTSEKVVEYKKDEYMISVAVKGELAKYSPTYGGFISKRVLGPVYTGLFLFTDSVGGATLSLGF